MQNDQRPHLKKKRSTGSPIGIQKQLKHHAVTTKANRGDNEEVQHVNRNSISGRRKSILQGVALSPTKECIIIRSKKAFMGNRERIDKEYSTTRILEVGYPVVNIRSSPI